MKKLLIDFGNKLPHREDLEIFMGWARRFISGDEPVLCVWGGVKVTVLDVGEPSRKVRKVSRKKVRRIPIRRAEVYSKLLNSGIVTMNEARERMGVPTMIHAAFLGESDDEADAIS